MYIEVKCGKIKTFFFGHEVAQNVYWHPFVIIAVHLQEILSSMYLSIFSCLWHSLWTFVDRLQAYQLKSFHHGFCIGKNQKSGFMPPKRKLIQLGNATSDCWRQERKEDGKVSTTLLVDGGLHDSNQAVCDLPQIWDVKTFGHHSHRLGTPLPDISRMITGLVSERCLPPKLHATNPAITRRIENTSAVDIVVYTSCCQSFRCIAMQTALSKCCSMFGSQFVTPGFELPWVQLYEQLCKDSESLSWFGRLDLRYSNQYPIEVLKEHGAGTVICVECCPDYSPVCYSSG